jgi:hypothetical protein
VDIPLTCSWLVAKYKVETNCAICNSIFLLNFIYSLTTEEKLSNLAFILSTILSLKLSFLEIFSLILACSNINSLKGGCL